MKKFYYVGFLFYISICLALNLYAARGTAIENPTTSSIIEKLEDKEAYEFAVKMLMRKLQQNFTVENCNEFLQFNNRLMDKLSFARVHFWSIYYQSTEGWEALKKMEAENELLILQNDKIRFYNYNKNISSDGSYKILEISRNKESIKIKTVEFARLHCREIDTFATASSQLFEGIIKNKNDEVVIIVEITNPHQTRDFIKQCKIQKKSFNIVPAIVVDSCYCETLQSSLVDLIAFSFASFIPSIPLIDIENARYTLKMYDLLKENIQALESELLRRIENSTEQLDTYLALSETLAKQKKRLKNERTDFLSNEVILPYLSYARFSIFGVGTAGLFGRSSEEKERIDKAMKILAKSCHKNWLMQADEKTREEFISLLRHLKSILSKEEMEDYKVITTLMGSIDPSKPRGAEAWLP